MGEVKHTHEFVADPYTSKCAYCGLGRARHAEALVAAERIQKAAETEHVANDMYSSDPLLSSLREENERLRKEVDRCHERLEIDHVWVIGENDDSDLERRDIPMEERGNQIDGIECRDATITVLEQDITASQAQLKIYREALEPFAKFSTADGAGFEDEFFRLHDDTPVLGEGLGDNWRPVIKIGDFRRARTALSQEPSNAS